MDLRSRLAQLEHQAGAAREAPGAPVGHPFPLHRDAPASPAPTDLSLNERLLRLAATRKSYGNARATAQDVAGLLGGTLLADGLVVVERSLSLGCRHGEIELSALRDLAWPLDGPRGTPRPERTLFLDTETTGLAGGTGTLPFLIGAARVEAGQLRLRQYFLTGFGGESAMLRHVQTWTAGVDRVVSFNGKCFDMPLLATRYRLARLPDPFSGIDHLDLVHATRSAFSRVWPDCRLQTAEQRLLGFFRGDDVPGEAIPQLWFDFVRQGVTRTLPAVLEHNRLDLLSLAVLLASLARVFVSPGHACADALGIARAHRRSGGEARAYEHLAAARPRLEQRGLLELARLHRRHGAWRHAIEIWTQLAEQGCLEAVERLATYYERIAGDLASARTFAQRAARARPDDANNIKRMQRIERKLGLALPGAGCSLPV